MKTNDIDISMNRPLHLYEIDESLFFLFLNLWDIQQFIHIFIYKKTDT